MSKTGPSMLGVLLCYNDGDVLPDAIEHLLENHHDVVAWDHGSTDDTPDVLDRYRSHLLECQFVPRSVDFYGLYPAMSEHLLATYSRQYDWISWPDQDEILEGPDRCLPYHEHVRRVWESGSDWIQFHNLNFWFTEADPEREVRPTRRVRHYALFPDCSPRIRSWRSSATNRREFNHNPPLGVRHPEMFKLRHYPMRSAAQSERRLTHDRAGLMRNGLNYHYENMQRRRTRVRVAPDDLHVDDGVSELSLTPAFDWRQIYGSQAPTEK